MPDIPFTVNIPLPSCVPSHFDRHVERRLSSMRGQYQDAQAYETLLAQSDVVLYEVFEIRRPEISGELLSGISIVHPGRVGNEFYMTKGHFHAVLETAEIYYCLKGEGFMVMEDPEGNCSVESLVPGRYLFVPPRWAHRSVCVGRQEDLVTFFIYPGHAGHDYGTIEKQGFRKIVIDSLNGVEIIDNPHWKV